MTQTGIAEGARVLRSHVPRTIQALEAQGLVDMEASHLRGHSRKTRVYRLTPAGVRRAREILSALDTVPVDLDGRKTSLGDARRALILSPLSALFSIDAAGHMNPASVPTSSGDLLQRDADLAFLRRWFAGPARVAVVYGSRGIGKTSLARTFSRAVPRTAWLDLDEPSGLEVLSENIARSTGCRPSDPLRPAAAAQALFTAFDRGIRLVVLDGYGEAPEECVEVFAIVVRDVRAPATGKLLVLAQESTPAYSRFYGRADVDAGRVVERHLRGLDLEGTRAMLRNPAIDEEALRRIYLLTKGCPLYLECIRDGDANRLQAASRFTKAEIRLLLYSGRLAGVTTSAT